MRQLRVIITYVVFISILIGCEPTVTTSTNENNSYIDAVHSDYKYKEQKILGDKYNIVSYNPMCVMDNSKKISMFYDMNLEKLTVNGYEKFVLINTEETEIGKNRPHEFTRTYKNKSDYTAELSTQGASQYLTIKDKNGSIKEFDFSYGIECGSTKSNSELLKYMVIVDRAYIHMQPELDTRTSSYFIKNDYIEALSIKDEWIKVSYLNNKKTGWLQVGDVRFIEDDSSVLKVKSNESLITTQQNNVANKYVITKIGLNNIILGKKFNQNEFDEFEVQLEGVDNCILANSKNFPEYRNYLSFQFVDNILTGISISQLGDNDNNFESYTGVKIGENVDSVIRKHGKQPDEKLESPYTDDSIFIFWVDEYENIGIRYDMANDQVSSMSLNYNENIRYFEGCG